MYQENPNFNTNDSDTNHKILSISKKVKIHGGVWEGGGLVGTGGPGPESCNGARKSSPGPLGEGS